MGSPALFHIKYFFCRGRTVPNLHDALHCDADILQLDVIAVGEVMATHTSPATTQVAVQSGEAACDQSSAIGLTFQ